MVTQQYNSSVQFSKSTESNLIGPQNVTSSSAMLTSIFLCNEIKLFYVDLLNDYIYTDISNIMRGSLVILVLVFRQGWSMFWPLASHHFMYTRRHSGWTWNIISKAPILMPTDQFTKSPLTTFSQAGHGDRLMRPQSQSLQKVNSILHNWHIPTLSNLCFLYTIYRTCSRSLATYCTNFHNHELNHIVSNWNGSSFVDKAIYPSISHHPTNKAEAHHKIFLQCCHWPLGKQKQPTRTKTNFFHSWVNSL